MNKIQKSSDENVTTWVVSKTSLPTSDENVTTSQCRKRHYYLDYRREHPAEKGLGGSPVGPATPARGNGKRRPLLWWQPSDPAICSRCSVAIPDEWIPLVLHATQRDQVLRFCSSCAPKVTRYLNRLTRNVTGEALLERFDRLTVKERKPRRSMKRRPRVAGWPSAPMTASQKPPPPPGYISPQDLIRMILAGDFDGHPNDPRLAVPYIEQEHPSPSHFPPSPSGVSREDACRAGVRDAIPCESTNEGRKPTMTDNEDRQAKTPH